MELVPGLVWVVVKEGEEQRTKREGLHGPTLPPRRTLASRQEASFLETLLIVALIHLLFEHGAVGPNRYPRWR